jgi:undecaprenyl phosphate-alpha-L-ara4N flippase subunit ArnF
MNTASSSQLGTLHGNPRLGLLFVASSVILVSAAQLLLKLGAHGLTLHELNALSTLVNPHWLLHTALPIALGLACYLSSMLVWLRALGELPLSVAYPLLSLSYPLVYIAALLLPGFHETLSTTRVLGLLLASVGIALLAPRTSSINTD